MERALRKKFVLIAFGAVFVVLLTIATVMNVWNYAQVDAQANEILEVMGENDGKFPLSFDRPTAHMSAETPYATRYFVVKVNDANQLISTDTKSIQMVTTQSAIEYAQEALNTKGDSGLLSHYQYKIFTTDYGKLMIFIDCSQELNLFQSFLTSSVLVCAVVLLCVLALMIPLSKKVVAPVVESYRKQQQFITNITHELKTPLAIIKTNTEVMEMESESSQWSESIHNQIGRLTELINYLISLSKMEEDTAPVKVAFSLSDAVHETVESFDILAENQSQVIVQNIQPNVTYRGDERSIRLLISILLDNAVKYSSDTSPITIALSQQKDKVHIHMQNSADNLTVGKYDMLFQRFYRMESSRNSKLGGFGIGLAMAKTIVKNHGGTIKAECKDGIHLEFFIDI